MNFRKIITTALIALSGLFFTIPGQAQTENGDSGSIPSLALNSPSYKTAIGLRAGGTSGITVKHFISQNNALEGIVGVWHHGLSTTLLFERYVGAFNTQGLNWYYGAGGHATIHTGHVYEHNDGIRHRHYHSGDFGLGVDGIVGLEYKIQPIPFAVSFDLKPYAEINSGGGFWMAVDPGLGIKLTF